MIIGLSGYAQSGKDTVAKILIENYGYERVAFADAIKDLLIKMNPILEDGYRLNEHVQEFGWELAKARPEVRRLLQDLGLGARVIIDDHIWVVAALQKMYDVDKNYVITDVRFENEAVMVKQIFGEVWRIEREGVGPINSHVSESQLSNWDFDRIINNNGTLEYLAVEVKTHMDTILV